MSISDASLARTSDADTRHAYMSCETVTRDGVKNVVSCGLGVDSHPARSRQRSLVQSLC